MKFKVEKHLNYNAEPRFTGYVKPLAAPFWFMATNSVEREDMAWEAMKLQVLGKRSPNSYRSELPTFWDFYLPLFMPCFLLSALFIPIICSILSEVHKHA